MDAPVLALAVLLGVGIGLLSGMLGIGGGLMMVPLFRLGFALEAIQATATSLFVIVPTSVAGLVRHVRNGTCLPVLGVAAGLAGAATSPVGVHLAAASPGWLVMGAAAIAIGTSAVAMLRRASAASGAQPSNALDAAGGPPAAVPHATTGRMIGLGMAVGVAAGLLAGYIGVGGGIVMMPLFVSVLGLPMKKASGTSLAAVCILAIPGVVQQMALGNVHVALAIAIACGSIPGAFAGANLVKRLPEQALRLALGVLLLVVAVVLVAHELLQ